MLETKIVGIKYTKTWQYLPNKGKTNTMIAIPSDSKNSMANMQKEFNTCLIAKIQK
jgi:hypothetical protein